MRNSIHKEKSIFSSFQKTLSSVLAVVLLITPALTRVGSAQTAPTSIQDQNVAEIASILFDWNELPFSFRNEYMITKVFPTIDSSYPSEFREMAEAISTLNNFIQKQSETEFVQQQVQAKFQQLGALDSLKGLPASDITLPTDFPDLIELSRKYSIEERTALFFLAWDQISIDANILLLNAVEDLPQEVVDILGLENLDSNVLTLIQLIETTASSNATSLTKALIATIELLSAIVEQPAFAADIITDLTDEFNSLSTPKKVGVVIAGLVVAAGVVYVGSRVARPAAQVSQVARAAPVVALVKVASDNPTVKTAINNSPLRDVVNTAGLIERLRRGTGRSLDTNFARIGRAIDTLTFGRAKPILTPPSPSAPGGFPVRPGVPPTINPNAPLPAGRVQIPAIRPTPPGGTPPPATPPSTPTPPAPVARAEPQSAFDAIRNRLGLARDRLPAPADLPRGAPTRPSTPVHPALPPTINPTAPVASAGRVRFTLPKPPGALGAAVAGAGTLGAAGAASAAPKPPAPPSAPAPKPVSPGVDPNEVRDEETPPTPPPPTPPPAASSGSQPRRTIAIRTPDDQIDQGTARDPRNALTPSPSEVDLGNEPDPLDGIIRLPSVQNPGGASEGGAGEANPAGLPGEVIALPDQPASPIEIIERSAPGQQGSGTRFVDPSTGQVLPVGQSSGDGKSGGGSGSSGSSGSSGGGSTSGGSQSGTTTTSGTTTESGEGKGQGAELPDGKGGQSPDTPTELDNLRRALANAGIDAVQGRRITEATPSGPSNIIRNPDEQAPSATARPGNVVGDPGSEVSGSGTTGTVGVTNNRDNLSFDLNRASSGEAIPLDLRTRDCELRGNCLEDASGTAAPAPSTTTSAIAPSTSITTTPKTTSPDQQVVAAAPTTKVTTFPFLSKDVLNQDLSVDFINKCPANYQKIEVSSGSLPEACRSCLTADASGVTVDTLGAPTGSSTCQAYVCRFQPTCSFGLVPAPTSTNAQYTCIAPPPTNCHEQVIRSGLETTTTKTITVCDDFTATDAAFAELDKNTDPVQRTTESTGALQIIPIAGASSFCPEGYRFESGSITDSRNYQYSCIAEQAQNPCRVGSQLIGSAELDSCCTF